MTNPCIISNIRLDLTKKAYEYSLELKCSNIVMMPQSGGRKSTVAANVDKKISFNNPSQPIRAQKTGTDVVLNWVMLMEKKGATGDPKKYDKTINVPIKKASQPQQYTVQLGKVGSVVFMGDAVDEAERLRREQAEKDRQAQEAAQAKSQEEARQRAEQERLQKEKEEAERVAAIEQQRKEKEMQDAQAFHSMVADQAEKEMHLYVELELAEGQLMDQKRAVMKMIDDERHAMEWEKANRPPVWGKLNPELRIARLFQEPNEFDVDPIFDAICAPPTALPPPATTRDNNSPMRPGARGGSPSPGARNPVTAALHSGPRASDRNPSPTAIVHNSQRKTPLNIVFADMNDLSSVTPREGEKKFGAIADDDDLKELRGGSVETDDGDGIFLNNPEFQPDGKLYRMKKFEPGSNPLGPMKEGEELPPLESLPRVLDDEYDHHHQQQQQQSPRSGSPSSKGKNVSFAGDKSQQATAAAAAAAAAGRSGSAVTAVSGSSSGRTTNTTNNPLSDPGNAVEKMEKSPKRRLGPQPRFDVDLEPAPPLMSALLHLSRNGGYMNAMVPVNEQYPSSSSAAAGDHSTTAAAENPAAAAAAASAMTPDERKRLSDNVFERLGPTRLDISPSRADDEHHSGHRAGSGSPHNPHENHSMSPRRQLPLVFTSVGEVVSRSSRIDRLNVPSFAQPLQAQTQELIHYGAAGVGPNVKGKDPAQSYWNCFAPQKAQNLVGVRMPASAASAFEQAAAQQVDLSGPKRANKPYVPSGNHQSPYGSTPRRRPNEEHSSLRSVVKDAGESAAHRSHRKMF